MSKGNSFVIAGIVAAAFALAFASNAAALPVSADALSGDQAAPEEPATSEPQPRYRLGTPAGESEDAARVEHKTEAQFAWPVLTARGPASGEPPRVGESSGKSYFDFHDGLEHPYYILKLRKE